METLGEGKFLRLVKENNWEWAERPCRDAVAVIAITGDDKVIFISQYRVPVKSHVIEIPAGLIGDVRSGETPQDAIRAELIEEAGYEATEVYDLGYTPASPGLTSERIQLYIADGVKKVSKGGGDESEDITVYEVDLREIDSWLRDRVAEGYLVDMKVYAGLFLAYQAGYLGAL